MSLQSGASAFSSCLGPTAARPRRSRSSWTGG